MAETSYIIQNGKMMYVKDASARKSIGSCGNLKTETKHCLVDAINELNDKVGGGGGGTSLDGLEATVDELNALVDVEGNVQEQLDGKAPYGLITATHSADTDEALLADLDSVISGMANGTAQKIIMTGGPNTFLGGFKAEMEIFRNSAGYCTVKAYTYMNTAGGSIKEYNNSKYGGVWQEWTRNYNTGYKPKLADLGLTATADELNVLDGGITESKITHGAEDSWENELPPFSRTNIDRSRANRFALLPAENILVEWSTDDGATWEEVTTFARANKVNLLTNSIASGALPLGATLSASVRLRITLTAPTTTRANLRQIYTDITTQGHALRLDIEGAKRSDPNTFSVLREGVKIGGWNGPNMINIPSIRWGTAADTDWTKIRLTYRIKSVTAGQTGRPSVLAIKGYGNYAWYMHHNLALDDCLYNVDYSGNATFPADLTAKTIAGVTPTEIGYLDGATGNIQEQLDNKLPTTGGIITGPLAFSGGDRTTSGKIVLDSANSSQITDGGTATLFGFTGNGTSNLTVGNSAYNLVMRGKASRPTYNAAHMAMLSDLEEATADIQQQIDVIKETQTSGAEAMTEATIRAICT